MKSYPALLLRLNPVSGCRRKPVKAGRTAFSLVEVVMAIGVLGVTVVALLGLFGPTMTSVNHVLDRSGAQAAASRFDSALRDNEIYHRVLGTSMTATVSESDLKSLEGQLGDYVNTNANSPTSDVDVLPFFAWREFSSAHREKRVLDGLEFKLAGVSGEKPTMPSAINPSFMREVDGSIYLILVSEPAPRVKPSGGGSMVEEFGYLPVKVSIFDYKFVPGQTMNDTIQSYAKLNKGKPLVEYTTIIPRP